MDMLLKVAQRSAHHGDWTYFSGFDRVEKEDNWFIYLDKSAVIDEENGIGQGPTYKLMHEAPGELECGHLMSAFEHFVCQADLTDLCEKRVKRVHVSCIHMMVREPDGAYHRVGSLLCNTAAFLMNVSGANIDKLV